MDRARWAPAADGGVDSLTGTSLAAGTPAGRGGSGRSAKGAGRRRAVPSCVAPCVCLCVSPCVSTSCARVCGAVCLRGRSRGAPLGQPPSLGRAAWPRPAPRVCLQHCGARPVSGGPGLHWPQPTDLSTACAQVTAQRSRPRERWLRGLRLSLLAHMVSGASVCWWMGWRLLQSSRWGRRVLPALLSHRWCLEHGGFMGLTCVHLRLQIRATPSASSGLTGGVGGEGHGQGLRSRGPVLDWSFLRAGMGSPDPHPALAALAGLPRRGHRSGEERPLSWGARVLPSTGRQAGRELQAQLVLPPFVGLGSAQGSPRMSPREQAGGRQGRPCHSLISTQA